MFLIFLREGQRKVQAVAYHIVAAAAIRVRRWFKSPNHSINSTLKFLRNFSQYLQSFMLQKISASYQNQAPIGTADHAKPEDLEEAV